MRYFISILLFIICFTGQSEEIFKKREVVRIGYSDVVVRHAPDYLKVISNIYDQIGVDVENHILPSVRAISHFEKGMVDALGVRIDGYELLNRDAIKIPTEIHGNTITRAWILKSRKDEILSSKSISYSAVRGDISSLVYQIKTGVKINEFATTYRNVLKMMEKKRTDALICTDQLIQLTGNAEIYTPLDNKIVTHTLHHFIHKSKAHLLPKLQKVFEKEKGTQQFIKIKTRPIKK